MKQRRKGDWRDRTGEIALGRLYWEVLSHIIIHFEMFYSTNMERSTYVLLVLLIIWDTSSSFRSRKVKEVTKTLLMNYDPSVRPVKIDTDNLTIGIGFGLQNIFGLDEKKEIFSCRGWFDFIWTSEYFWFG